MTHKQGLSARAATQMWAKLHTQFMSSIWTFFMHDLLPVVTSPPMHISAICEWAACSQKQVSCHPCFYMSCLHSRSPTFTPTLYTVPAALTKPVHSAMYISLVWADLLCACVYLAVYMLCINHSKKAYYGEYTARDPGQRKFTGDIPRADISAANFLWPQSWVVWFAICFTMV